LSITTINGVKMRGVSPRGDLTGPYAKDVAKDWDTLWRMGWGRAKGGLSAQERYRNTSASGPESGRLKEIADAGQCTGWGSGG
jgi:hypothetical protein